MTYLKILCLIGFFLIGKEAYTQNIFGTVRSEEDKPLAGASIVFQGAIIGTVTNYKGEFKVKAPSGLNTIYCSFITYKLVQHKFIVQNDSIYFLKIQLVKDVKKNRKKEGNVTITTEP